MKQRLLVLTPRFPYPVIGGDRLRIYQLCRSLAADFDLSLLSLCESKEDMERGVPNDGVFQSVNRVYHPKSQRLLGMAKVLLSRTPFQVGYYWNPEFAKKLSVLAPLHDGLVAHLIRTGQYITGYQMPKILEMTDAISLSYKRTIPLAVPAKALAYRVEATRLQRYEREIITACDLTVLVSAVDRDFLLPGGDPEKTMICVNGVDTEALPFNYSPDGRTIVFIGKNTSAPNIDAILFFAEKILPLVQARCPNVVFKVIGQIKPELKSRLERMAGVYATGAIESVAEAAQHASVAVCPLRFGAGVQNKLLEYMSLGIPAVTSPIGLEGLSSIPGIHLSVAKSPEEWAEQICKLLLYPDKGLTLAKAGRQFVEQHHTWSTLLDPLSRSITKLMATGPTRSI
jgi:glycosyltransferase involved in cell wall biosynthesis